MLAIEAFGKNEQVKRVFWTFFIGMAGLVLARVMDPVTAQRIVGMITGMEVENFPFITRRRHPKSWGPDPEVK
jgi:hypothetical protein